MKKQIRLLPLLATLIAASTAHAQVSIDDLTFGTVSLNGNIVTAITDCDTAASGVLTIPTTAPDGSAVKVIASRAFKDCSQITEIMVPEGIEAIWQYAFQSCTSLEQISLPDSLQNINWYTFWNTGLTSLHLPRQITFIPTGLVRDCSQLSHITWESTITEIQAGAFEKCTSLATLDLSDTPIDTIADTTFYLSGIVDIRLPDTLKEIKSDAFEYCRSLRHIAIPAGVTNIAYQAFNQANNLNTVIMPKSAVNFEDRAFQFCNLTGIFWRGAPPLAIGADAFDSGDPTVHHCYPDQVTAFSSAGLPGSVNQVDYPFDGTDVASMEIVVTNNQIQIEFPETAGTTDWNYEFQISSDIIESDWSTITPTKSMEGNTATYILPIENTPHYHRVSAENTFL